MQGSIRKHIATDGTVSYRVRVDITDPTTGRRHQPQRTFRTKREAEAGLARWLVEIESGTAVDRTAQTVGQYLQSWLDGVRHRVRASTHASYRKSVQTYVVPALGAVPLQKLTAQRLQTFYNRLLGPAGGHKGGALGAGTVRYVHSILHAALADALRLGLVARNVADAVRAPQPPRQEARAWDADEVRRFLDHARGDPYWPLWLIALHTGMRRGEILSLRWRDVDLERAWLRVRAGKSGGRIVDLDTACVAALQKYRTTQVEHRLVLGPLWQDDDLVFPGELGRPLGASTVGRHFRALGQQAGCSPLTFHGLRHTHASILMLAGVHPKVVSERLGHATIALTLQVYSHVLPRMRERAAEAFAAAIGEQ